jgi:hypothetical protein
MNLRHATKNENFLALTRLLARLPSLNLGEGLGGEGLFTTEMLT